MDRKSAMKLKIKDFAIKHKNKLITGVLVFLLACITIYVSYAYYQSRDEDPIINGEVGVIPDFEVRIMAQNRNEAGVAIDGYSEYPYIPEAGYKYNREKSYCANGSTIQYHENTFDATILASKTDLCFLYFDATADVDITLNVFAENIDNEGKGTGTYTKLETTALPSAGYKYNSQRSSCKYGSKVSYSTKDNMFLVEASRKDSCDVYMDAIAVDIILNLHIQDKNSPTEYYDAKTVPPNTFYTLNEKSDCTGTSSLSLNNQRVIISATGKTVCDAYLDIGTGPIIEDVETKIISNNLNLSFNESNLGSLVRKWYYKVDDGDYQSTTNDNVTVKNDYEKILVYGEDASGNKSDIAQITPNEPYYYHGEFSYSSASQKVQIKEEGYYKFEVWGAQGGSYSDTYQGGAGGYASGTIKLDANTMLFIHTGGQPTIYNQSATAENVNAGGYNGGGAGRTYSYDGTTTYGLGGGGGTDIAIGTDDFYHRVIVAGGGSGSTNISSGFAGGGINGSSISANYYGTQTSAGVGGDFGIGGSSSGKYNNKYGAAGGGGGWYGGGSSTSQSNTSSYYAQYMGGGSGFVFTSTSKIPENYGLNNSYYMQDVTISDGTKTFLSPDGIEEQGHKGNGYVRITYLGKNLEGE